MVIRNSQDAQFNSPGVTAVDAGNPIGRELVQPDGNKYATGGVIDTPGAGSSLESSSDRVLQSILGVTQGVAEDAIGRSKEEAYLSGVAQAGTIQSEDQLQSNIVTRNWATAGYRDTVGRLAAADNQQQIATDMQTMREKSPEEFADYLAEKRQTVLDSFQGMSLDTRKTMFAQQMMNDRAAIQKHSSEHYQFVVDQENKSVNAANFASMNALSAAKNDAPTYGAATDAAYTTGLSSIVYNPKLPPDMKSKLVGQLAEQALATDNQALFLKMQQTDTTLPDGTSRPMLSMADNDQQIKLSGMYRDSLKRTEGFRAQSYMDDSAKMQADWGNPTSPLQPIEDVRAFLTDGIQRGFVSADQYKTTMEQYYKTSEQKANVMTLSGAYQTGNSDVLLRLNKTPDEGLAAFKATALKTMSTSDAVQALFKVGLNTGQENAFKAAGEIMAPAFVQLGNRQTVDPGQAASLAGVMQTLDNAKNSGAAGAYSQFISALAPDQQAKVTLFRDNLAQGQDPVSAITGATARVLQDSQMTPAQRAELSSAKAKDIRQSVDDLTPRGIWDTTVLYGKRMLGSAQASGELALRPFSGWTDNTARANEVMAGAKLAVIQKMDSISQQNPSLPATSIKELAISSVVGRTVGTDWGPLVVPDGFTPQRYFGVLNSVPSDRIASAMQEYIKPAPGNKMAFSVGVSGELVAKELNNQDQLVKSQTMDPKVIAPLVLQQQHRAEQVNQANTGEGVTKTVGSATVNYNGLNTANVEPAWVRRWRDDVVSHEGVVNTPATDLSGKIVNGSPVQTVGVGVSSHNPNYPAIQPDGTVSNADISKSFAAASNTAAIAGQRAMQSTVNNEPAFKLLSSIAYQSGTNFSSIKEYNHMLQGMGSNNYDFAHTALVNSPAYKASQPTRQKYYEDQLKAAMKD